MEEYRMLSEGDVFSFAAAISRFIRGAFAHLLTAIRQTILVVVVTLILVGSAGAAWWYNTKPTYEASMTCMFNSLNHATYGQMIQKLDKLAKDGSYQALAQNLKIAPDLAKSIVSIEGRNMAGSLLYEDPTADKSPMYFTVSATDNKVYAPLQKALIDYMNQGNPFRARRDTLELESINTDMAAIRANIALADTFINAYTYYIKNRTSAQDSILSSQNMLQMLSYRRDLDNKIKDNNWRLKEMQYYVELFNGFTPSDHPSRNDKKIIMTTAFAAVFSSLLLAILLYFRRSILKT